MRRVVTAVVVKTSKFALFASRQMISSRQSPSRSAVRTGVDLVPLFDEQPAAVSKVPPPALLIDVPSSSSRHSSASQ